MVSLAGQCSEDLRVTVASPPVVGVMTDCGATEEARLIPGSLDLLGTLEVIAVAKEADKWDSS